MKHLGLFEGIGGFSLAARWMGWETVAWCEWSESCQEKLKKRFPNAEAFGNIKESDFKKYANRIDIITGGFPCQPYSSAGKRKGKEDDRHLWPEMLRTIREVKAPWVVGENVFGIINWSGGLVFDEVQADLEAEGYEVQPYVLPACAKNAEHRRDRVWFVAYNDSFRQNRSDCNNEVKSNKRREYAQHDIEHVILHTYNSKFEGKCSIETGEGEFNGSSGRFVGWTTRRSSILKPIVHRNVHGLSRKLDEQRLFELGNAIVPQVAYEIFKAIEKYNSLPLV